MRARWLPVALVPLGTILGHALGYAAAGQDFRLSGTHGHLLPALWPAAAAMVVALGSVTLAGAVPGRGLRTSWLLGAQVVAFALLEGLEHLHGGHHGLSVVAEPAFRWGLGAQLLSAGLLVMVTRLAHASGQLVRSRLARRPAPPAPPAAAARRSWGRAGQSVPTGATASSVSERGPPGRLASA
jgi:hypothetical protein